MKNTIRMIALIGLIITQACDTNDCEDVACFTPPRGFAFELVDAQTRENLFTNGTFDSDQIQVLNMDDNSKREFSFISEDDLNIIQIGSIGWETEIAEVVLKVGDKTILNLYVDCERLSRNCCSFTEYNEIRIENAEYELDQQSEVYTVLIQQ
ncbi:hypothetical protein [Lutimonas sp.]|uniref:hypothetical protein n=1 Tax=Lutimonas sp. TaxID=1872403 RepID=UPI003D9BE792